MHLNALHRLQIESGWRSVHQVICGHAKNGYAE